MPVPEVVRSNSTVVVDQRHTLTATEARQFIAQLTVAVDEIEAIESGQRQGEDEGSQVQP